MGGKKEKKKELAYSPCSTSLHPFARPPPQSFSSVAALSSPLPSAVFSPSNSITFQLRVPPGIPWQLPQAQRQTAESVGNLTQHKLRCEAEVSESVGCIRADRGTVKNREWGGGRATLASLQLRGRMGGGKRERV